MLNTSYLNYCNFHYFQWSYSWKGWLLRKICALRASTDSLHKQHCMHVVSTFVHFTFNRWSSQELERTVRSCLYLTEWLKSICTIHILNKKSGFFSFIEWWVQLRTGSKSEKVTNLGNFNFWPIRGVCFLVYI